MPLAPPALLARLCDDAAVFPPGNQPLAGAVPAHLSHRRASHAGLVGPFVVSAGHLPELAGLTAGLPAGVIELALTVRSPHDVAAALAAAFRVPAVRVAALEVALPPELDATAVVSPLDATLDQAAGPTCYVELPRDGRRDELLHELAGSSYLAKLRTGGVTTDLFPDEAELASTIIAAVGLGVPFKATAGLHHAARGTDPVTGLEQHGFLNLLAATDAALGGDAEQVADLLAERHASRLADLVPGLSPRLRETFRSFGTCSIAEPLLELTALGLLDPATTKDLT